MTELRFGYVFALEKMLVLSGAAERLKHTEACYEP
jgi:hypothetical protein